MPDSVVSEGCANSRQGDVLDFSNGHDLTFINGVKPERVVIVSQTCDVVQSSKKRCLIAPIIPSTSTELKEARKGRKPLHLYLSGGMSGYPDVIADLEQMVSVDKDQLQGRTIEARYVSQISSVEAGQLGARVGRAFNRFPFPDEVYPFFKGLRSKIQSRAGTTGPFGQVVDLIEDIRVQADQWATPGRTLKIYIVLEADQLILADDADPTWEWSSARVKGMKSNESRNDLALNRICELILLNGDDPSTMMHLWNSFGRKLYKEILHDELSDEVLSCSVEVISDEEFTYRQYVRSESLDLEVLSDSTN